MFKLKCKKREKLKLANFRKDMMTTRDEDDRPGLPLTVKHQNHVQNAHRWTTSKEKWQKCLLLLSENVTHSRDTGVFMKTDTIELKQECKSNRLPDCTGCKTTLAVKHRPECTTVNITDKAVCNVQYLQKSSALSPGQCWQSEVLRGCDQTSLTCSTCRPGF